MGTQFLRVATLDQWTNLLGDYCGLIITEVGNLD